MNIHCIYFTGPSHLEDLQYAFFFINNHTCINFEEHDDPDNTPGQDFIKVQYGNHV